MDKFIFGLKSLMSVFLLICIGVHIAGIISPITAEPLWSHIVHVVSYSVCLMSLVRQFSYAKVTYTIGAIYPFMYHARCAWQHYVIAHKFSPICILVVVLLPAGLALIWQNKAKTV